MPSRFEANHATPNTTLFLGGKIISKVGRGFRNKGNNSNKICVKMLRLDFFFLFLNEDRNA